MRNMLPEKISLYQEQAAGGVEIENYARWFGQSVDLAGRMWVKIGTL